MAQLRTDYKDEILDVSVNTQRKYRMINNEDGTVSFVDETVYLQNGDTFGAAELNEIVKQLIVGNPDVRYNKETDYLEVKVGDGWEMTSLKANVGKLEKLIPKLTGYTSAKGNCVYSSVLSEDYTPWKAFDEDNSTIGGCSTSTSNYIGFQWSNEVYVDNVSVAFLYTHGDTRSLNLKLQYYNGTSWVDVENSAFSETFVGGSGWVERNYDFSVKKTVKGIRFYGTVTSGDAWALQIREMQAYGR